MCVQTVGVLSMSLRVGVTNVRSCQTRKQPVVKEDNLTSCSGNFRIYSVLSMVIGSEWSKPPVDKQSWEVAGSGTINYVARISPPLAGRSSREGVLIGPQMVPRLKHAPRLKRIRQAWYFLGEEGRGWDHREFCHPGSRRLNQCNPYIADSPKLFFFFEKKKKGVVGPVKYKNCLVFYGNYPTSLIFFSISSYLIFRLKLNI